MSRPRTMARDHHPALHNSGPGPLSVFRTAPVGTTHLLDLFGELHARDGLPPALRAVFAPQVTTYARRGKHSVLIPAAPVAPAGVVHVVAHLRAALPEPARIAIPRTIAASDAIAALEALRAHVAQLGALVPATALVDWQPRYDNATPPWTDHRVGQPLPWLSGVASLLQLAWLVCAVSHVAPPLIRFARTPSLRYWRPDGALSVRWLGATVGRA